MDSLFYPIAKKKNQGTLEFSDAGALHATSFLFYYRGGRQKKTQSENTKNDKKTPMNRCHGRDMTYQHDLHIITVSTTRLYMGNCIV